MKRLLLMLVLIPILTSGCGLVQMYPKFFDDPEFKKEMAQAFKESQKNWELNGDITNPEIEFFYKISVGAGTKGIVARGRINGATTGNQSNITEH